MNSSSTPLSILIVEDEFIIADEISMIVEQAGHVVLGPVGTIEEAFRLLDGKEPQFAIVDANLNGRSSAPLAERLQALGVPFCVCTGYRSEDISPLFGQAAILQKPVDSRALLAIINASFPAV